mmetsp:Transcript_32604/g.54905  ORF Transcript_32604/g.54905 Transcript_32604/m.54905 type:complete len:92 (-) Transcript_32604:95-370(-)
MESMCLLLTGKLATLMNKRRVMRKTKEKQEACSQASQRTAIRCLSLTPKTNQEGTRDTEDFFLELPQLNEPGFCCCSSYCHLLEQRRIHFF